MCVCVYVCICVCVYLCMCVCVYLCMCVCVYLCMCVFSLFLRADICVDTLKKDWKPTHGIEHLLLVDNILKPAICV